MQKKRFNKFIIAVIVVFVSALIGLYAYHSHVNSRKVRIGVAWTSDTNSIFYTYIVKAIEYAGGEAVPLGQVKVNYLPYTGDKISSSAIAEQGYLLEEFGKLLRENGYKDSNAAQIFADLDAVVFTGGEDISPTIFAKIQPWHGIQSEIDYNSTRDVSDYVGILYCLDKNIPFIGFCRGMQMLGVVSGATVIQDIPTYFKQINVKYDNEHRNPTPENGSFRDFASHELQITDTDSLMYAINKAEKTHGAASWHHQALLSVDGTPLKVTAICNTNGVDMIEAIERSDKPFALGLQFHPEAAINKHLDQVENANKYMNFDEAVAYFHYLLAYCKKNRCN